MKLDSSTAAETNELWFHSNLCAQEERTYYWQQNPAVCNFCRNGPCIACDAALRVY